MSWKDKFILAQNDSDIIAFVRLALANVTKRISIVNPALAFAGEGLQIEEANSLWAHMVYNAETDVLTVNKEACDPSSVLAEVLGKNKFQKEIERLLCHELGHRVWERLPSQEKEKFLALGSDYKGTNYANSYENNETKLIEKFADAFAGCCCGRARRDIYDFIRNIII